jgi:hypothetical protein
MTRADGPHRPPAFASPRDAALALLNGDYRLTRKAGSFLGQLVAEPWAAMSDRQAEWLAILLDRNGLPALAGQVRQ